MEKLVYSEAKKIADIIVETLRPYCDRIEIAGSIRRCKELVSDIEIVAIPAADPFQFAKFCTVINAFQKVRGEPTGKSTQRLFHLRNDVTYKIDFFFATPENWGWIFFLRTGSKEFNIAFLEKLRAYGITSIEGYLHRNERRIDTREEIDIFTLVNHIFVDPKDRV